MSYTRSWTDTTPQDSDPASNLGLYLRNLRQDIHERMDTLTNSTWDSDPTGGPLTMQLFIPPSVGCRDDTNDIEMTVDETELEPSASASNISVWYVPIIIPVGCTLTNVRAAINLTGSGAVGSLGVKVVTMIAATSVTLGSGASPTIDSAWHWVDAALTDHLVAVNEIITAAIVQHRPTSGHSKFGGLEVTYTRPALWNCY